MKAHHVLHAGLCEDVMCQSIIDDAEKLVAETATIDRGEVNAEMRRADVRWLPTWEKQWQDLTAFMMHYMRQANAVFGFDVDWIHSFQYTVYEAANEGKYDEHVDVFFDDRSLEHRKISMILQLSDPADYDGGDLVMRPLFGGMPDATLLRQRGTLLFFPAFTPHRVTPVTRGTRRSLVGWFTGPMWR